MKNFYVVKSIFAKLFIVVSATAVIYACHADSSGAKQRAAASKDVNTANASNTSSLLNSTSSDKSQTAQLPANTKSKFETATGLTLPDNAKILVLRICRRF